MAIVPVDKPQDKIEEVVVYDSKHELSETLREDGRLLRMFVARGEHRQPEAREHATRDWLIRGEFYDNWVEEFAKRYAPADSKDAAEVDENSRLALVKECEGALAVKEQVDKLEQTLREADGDVYKLRDALLAACKDLSCPRRFLGEGTGQALTPEAIEQLRMRRQVRLREVISCCLEGIWKSGIGGEVLRVAMEHVQLLIARFEEKEEDVALARQGSSWNKLKSLVLEIEGQMPELEGSQKRSGAPAPEGRGTKLLIEKALTDLGGEASTRQLFNWVRAHPDEVEEHSRVRINRRRKTSGKQQYEVWQSTVQNALHKHFEKVKHARGGPFVWRARGASAPTAMADAAPEEGAPEGSGLREAPEPERAPKARRRSDRAAGPAAAPAAAGAGGEEAAEAAAAAEAAPAAVPLAAPSAPVPVDYGAALLGGAAAGGAAVGAAQA